MMLECLLTKVIEIMRLPINSLTSFNGCLREMLILLTIILIPQAENNRSNIKLTKLCKALYGLNHISISLINVKEILHIIVF